MLRQNDGGISKDDDEEEDNDVLGSINVEFDADGDVPVSFEDATPGDYEVMVGSAEQADMLDDVSIANADDIECITNTCSDRLGDVSTINVDSTDCDGAGSGSGSGSGSKGNN